MRSVISRHAPSIEGLVSYPQTEEEVANNEALLAEATDTDILPEVRIDGEVVEPLTLDSCYRQTPSTLGRTSAKRFNFDDFSPFQR